MSWMPSWAYRRRVTLTEQSSGSYNSYPTIITVAYDAKMENDFADCRFTEPDGTTLIPYGIVEKTDGVSCTFVITRNYTPSCSLIVYLYYGNPGVADASVDHGPWALAWYQANGIGQSTSVFTVTTCTVYSHEEIDAIPSWADVVFGGCTANGVYRAYRGRVKINGAARAWATTAVCNGLANPYWLKWLKYRCSDSMYDDAAFNIGASNTLQWGHYQGGTPGFWVSWYPVDPSVSFGSEELAFVELLCVFRVGQGSEDLFTQFHVGQDAVDLPAQFEVGQGAVDLKAGFDGQVSLNLPAEFVVRQETSVDLPASFDGQVSLNLPGEFVIRRSAAVDLPAQFEVGQGSVNLLGEFVVRHVGTPVNLPAEFVVEPASASMDLKAIFEVGQGSENLPAELTVRQETSVDLPASFDAQTSVDLLGEFIVRHSISVDLPASFVVNQWQEDLPARFRTMQIYDLRGTQGIAFYWQGANNPPSSIVDFIMESPTGFWVGEFYDGPAQLRYVFLPWSLLREVGLDGSRPDRSQVDGFIWVVHTDGLRRIDYIHAPLFGDLYAIFEVRRETSVDLPAQFFVRH